MNTAQHVLAMGIMVLLIASQYYDVCAYSSNFGMNMSPRITPFKRLDIYFWLSLLFAIWFALTGYAWTYLANLFISLPFGILSFILWNMGRKEDPKPKRYKIVAGILAAGVIIAFVVLVMLLVKG